MFDLIGSFVLRRVLFVVDVVDSILFVRDMIRWWRRKRRTRGGTVRT